MASNAPVYTWHSLLVADGTQAPIPSTQLRPMHKPPLASAGIYWAGKNCTSGTAPGGRTAAVGSTTTSHQLVVSKCAFSRGPTKRTERPGHPRTLPLRFPSAGRSPPLQPVPFCHKRFRWRKDCHPQGKGKYCPKHIRVLSCRSQFGEDC